MVLSTSYSTISGCLTPNSSTPLVQPVDSLTEELGSMVSVLATLQAIVLQALCTNVHYNANLDSHG